MEFVFNLVAISIRCDNEFRTCVATFGFLECCKNQVSTCGLARGFLESVVFANCVDIYLNYPDKLELFVGWRPFCFDFRNSSCFGFEKKSSLGCKYLPCFLGLGVFPNDIFRVFFRKLTLGYRTVIFCCFSRRTFHN